MKTPKQKIEEMEKGCGKKTQWFELVRKCGQFEDLKHQDHIIFCSECKARLKDYFEGYEDGKNEVDEDKVEAHTQVTLNAILQERNRIRALIEGTKAFIIIDSFNAKHTKAIDFKKEILKELEEKQND